MSKKIIIALLFQFVLITFLYAGIEDAKVYYLDKEYQNAMEAALKAISSSSSAKEKEEAYFYLSLSQMKLGYFKEARDNFRTIINEFSQGNFTERAYLGVADCFFLEENFPKAVEIYESFLNKYAKSDLLPIAYFRLSQTHLKLGNWSNANKYLKELKDKFPDSLEARQSGDLLSRENFFTVQIGAFINQNSADKLCERLKEEGFGSYVAKTATDDGKDLYRVRVGKLSNRYDAEALQAALALKGYPTKIYP